MPKKVLALTPHPDDAEYFAGGLLARFVDEGAEVTIVIATDGRCGSYQYGKDELVTLRAEEARRASAVLGAQPPILLGHPDFELDRLPPGQLREEFIRQIRIIRPDVLVAEDVYAADEGHPDHRQVAWAAADAAEFSSLPLVHPEHIQEGLQSHFVTEKYFYAENNPRANKVVDVTSTFARKMAALAEHKTQVVFLVENLLQQARQAGIDLTKVSGPGSQDPLDALTWSQELKAAAVGREAGFQYGEAYRYVRYHPLVEMFLESSSAKES